MKRHWRNQLKATLRSLSSDRKREGAEQLVSLPIPSNGYVLSFMSTSSEISTYDLNHKLALEERLLLPRIEGKNLKAYFVPSLGDLIPGPWGLLEPRPIYVSHFPSIILVPGLGFDQRGNRLGHGMGYYDRFLAQHKESITIGIAFREQYIPYLPSEPHDIPLNHCFFC